MTSRAGVLNIEMQLQPIIHVASDGRSAKARWRTLEMKGVHGKAGQWGGGVQENEYVLKDGAWKISKLPLPPDAPPTEIYGSLPQVYVPPFHYAHPVRDARRAPMVEVPSALLPLQKKLTALNDEIDVLHLQRNYGYYVDKHLRNNVADLFAEQATLEIGGRGVFVVASALASICIF